MDGREAMTLSGSPYYMHHRGVAGSVSGTQSGFHGLLGFRSFSSPSAAVQSNVGGSLVGSTFQLQSSSAISPHGANTGVPSGVPQPPGEPVRRKRGRPRKYQPDGTVNLALSPLSSSPSPRLLAPTPKRGRGRPPGTGRKQRLESLGGPVLRKRGRPRKYRPDGTVNLALSPLSSSPSPGLLAPTPKQGRGRPPGTGRKQRLESLGEWISGSAGMGFAPHVITIGIGEDIAEKIMSFSQLRPRAVFILSANGAVSRVTLRQPAASGCTVTYEGRFQILCLSGSYLLNDNGGPRSRTGGLSVSLSSPDGCVIGGGIGGMLIAASPVQVVVGSFVYGGAKTKNKTDTGPKSGGDSEIRRSDKTATPASAPAGQSLTPTAAMGFWPASRPMDMRNINIDIDLMR